MLLSYQHHSLHINQISIRTITILNINETLNIAFFLWRYISSAAKKIASFTMYVCPHYLCRGIAWPHALRVHSHCDESAHTLGVHIFSRCTHIACAHTLCVHNACAHACVHTFRVHTQYVRVHIFCVHTHCVCRQHMCVYIFCGCTYFVFIHTKLESVNLFIFYF